MCFLKNPNLFHIKELGQEGSRQRQTGQRVGIFVTLEPIEGGDVSFLRKQESRLLAPQKSPSPGLAEGQAGLSTAGGEANCFIRLKCYHRRIFRLPVLHNPVVRRKGVLLKKIFSRPGNGVNRNNPRIRGKGAPPCSAMKKRHSFGYLGTLGRKERIRKLDVLNKINKINNMKEIDNTNGFKKNKGFVRIFSDIPIEVVETGEIDDGGHQKFLFPRRSTVLYNSGFIRPIQARFQPPGRDFSDPPRRSGEQRWVPPIPEGASTPDLGELPPVPEAN